MKYKEFEGPIEELVLMKLKQIEEKEQIKILHAVESGSRAWGLASPDSDYDVRFVYVRSLEYYLALDAKKDFIDWELNEELDINGWDLSKVLQHFHKSNAILYEWSNSPVVYYTTPEWKKIKLISEAYFSCKSAMYHYYGTANKNYYSYLTEDIVKYKKYFYVLRPILACKWIEKKKCPPPVLFQELVEEVLEKNMKQAVVELVNAKKQMTESEKGQKINKIDEYIVKNLEHFRRLVGTMDDDRKNDWKMLNEMFVSLIRGNI